MLCFVVICIITTIISTIIPYIIIKQRWCWLESWIILIIRDDPKDIIIRIRS